MKIKNINARETMNPFIQKTCMLVCVGILATAVSAQNYSIDWFTIDGGGGTSTGGVYTVNGTIGQPDAGGPLTGGSFSLTGGFWSLLSVVPTPGAPELTITLVGAGTAKVLWPSPSTGFVLQQNSNLSTTNWVVPPETVSDDGTNKFVIVNAPAGNRFYRLSHP
jgi:hypothetical protein